jgi:hypothetical protein
MANETTNPTDSMNPTNPTNPVAQVTPPFNETQEEELAVIHLPGSGKEIKLARSIADNDDLLRAALSVYPDVGTAIIARDDRSGVRHVTITRRGGPKGSTSSNGSNGSTSSNGSNGNKSSRNGHALAARTHKRQRIQPRKRLLGKRGTPGERSLRLADLDSLAGAEAYIASLIERLASLEEWINPALELAWQLTQAQHSGKKLYQLLFQVSDQIDNAVHAAEIESKLAKTLQNELESLPAVPSRSVAPA